MGYQWLEPTGAFERDIQANTRTDHQRHNDGETQLVG